MKRIKLLVAAVATLICGSMSAQTISANDVTIEKGGEADVTFTINSDSKAAIAEFKLDLPAGIAIQYDEDEEDYVYELGSSMTVKTHTATIQKQENGAFYVLVSNASGKEFKAATGDYLTVTLVADENAASGVATMREIILGNLAAEQMNTETEATFNITVPGSVEEATYTVAGTADLTGYDWDTTQNQMTLTEGLYTWTAENITVSNDVKPEFKIVKNGQEWIPADGNWVITPEVVGGEGIYTITITFNPEGNVITVTGVKTADIEVPVQDAYFVAGTTDLTGYEWDATQNEMTLTEGLYVWTATNITVSNEQMPQFKIVKNSDWNIAYPADNWVITPDVVGGEGIYTITITFNAQNNDITVAGEKTGDIEKPVELEKPYISANDVTIEAGGTATVTFTINSDDKAAIAEFKLDLPEGITVQFDEDEDDYVYDLGSAMTVKTHSATIKKQESGAFYVLVSNGSGKEFKAATGDYLTMTLEASADAVTGVAKMREIILGDLDANQMNTVTEFTFNITVPGTVGIDEVTVDQTTGVYNLKGQRVMNAQKGLYIQNGKKVVLK